MGGFHSVERCSGAGVTESVQKSADRRTGVSELDRLIARMRAGDRDAAASFFTDYGPRVRRRIRAKLAPHLRGLFDSMDLLSTFARRFDAYVAQDRFRADDESQLWRLVATIVDNAVIDKARIVGADRRAMAERTALERRLRELDPGAPDDGELASRVQRVAQQELSEQDREILALWMHGASLASISEFCELSPVATRKRWQRIREQLADGAQER